MPKRIHDDSPLKQLIANVKEAKEQKKADATMAEEKRKAKAATKKDPKQVAKEAQKFLAFVQEEEEEAKKNPKQLAKDIVGNHAFWDEVSRRYWRKKKHCPDVDWDSLAASMALAQGRTEVPPWTRPFPRYPPTWS